MNKGDLREILKKILDEMKEVSAIYISDPSGFMVDGISINERVYEEIPMSISLSIKELSKMEKFFYKERIEGIIIEKDTGFTYIIPFLNGKYILSIFGDGMNIGLVRYVVSKYKNKILSYLKELT